MEELQRTLDSLQAEGRLDSSSGFTIDLHSARQKLGLFQVADEAFYLLKTLQGALVAGARAVQVTLGRDRVRVSFDVPDMAPLLGLEEALGKVPSSGLSREVYHLTVALHAAWSTRPESLAFWFWDEHQSQRIRPHGNGFLQERVAERPGREIRACLLELRPCGEANRWKRLLSGIWARGRLHRGLAHRCAFYPISLQIDGRSVNDGSINFLRSGGPRSVKEPALPYNYHLVRRYLVSPGGPQDRVAASPRVEL